MLQSAICWAEKMLRCVTDACRQVTEELGMAWAAQCRWVVDSEWEVRHLR
jgi:hypothetical protein